MWYIIIIAILVIGAYFATRGGGSGRDGIDGWGPDGDDLGGGY